MRKTFQAIEADYSERASALLRDWFAATDAIARAPEVVEGPHAELLTDAQRAEVGQRQKASRAQARAEECRREYIALTEERNRALTARVWSLREGVYAVDNTEVLTRAALATDAQLGAMAELAATTGNDELGRAVFMAAEQRELGDVMHRYLDAMGEDAREAYEELKAAPSEEAMERKLADADALFAPPAAQDFAPSLGAAS
jgi:hypothetical protein